MTEIEIYGKLETLLKEFCRNDGIPRRIYAPILRAAKESELASLDSNQKFLLWDAIGCNDADIDVKDLEFVYKRLGALFEENAHRNTVNQ